jgi:saccharopine dehydrogenase-like NADP-dependent oxidoreductase
VIAGQGGAARFLKEGQFKYIPYHKLFRRTEIIEIDGYGKFEAYANRDSLQYQEAYKLEDVSTIFRGTVRRLGFSKAWNVFVQLGMTDDTYVMENSENMSYRDFVNAFLPYHPYDSVEVKLRSYLRIDPDDELWMKLEELDIFNKDKFFNIPQATPAQLLQKILMDKWTLSPDDKDMIVMLHRIGYVDNGVRKQIESSMVVIGDDPVCTAMSKTVGLPVGIAAIKILNREINTPGVQIPLSKDVYLPILEELKTHGIAFKEKQVPYTGYNPEQIVG